MTSYDGGGNIVFIVVAENKVNPFVFMGKGSCIKKFNETTGQLL